MEIVERNGWWLPASDKHFTKYAKVGKTYQSTLFNAAMTHIEDPKWALDIGAHVGFWSYQLSTRFPLVTAFEPIGESFACLRRNVPWVTCINKGVGRADRMLMWNPAPENSGAWEITPMGTANWREKPNEEVLLLSLDDWFAGEAGYTAPQGKIDLMKIDVQGMELDVLQTAEKLLAWKPVIVMEVVKNSQKDKAPIEFLKERGAEIFHEIGGDVIMGWR